MMVCDAHAETGPVIESLKKEKATTGSKYADRRVNQAVDMALLRLAPIIRDTIREEIKRMLQLEDEEDKSA